MSKQALPLATWKTWWTPEQAVLLATSLKNNIDVRRLPRGGCLLDKSDFRSEDLRDPHTATIVEGLLKAYPLDKQPSGYLLGDACLELDRLLNFGIFGDSKGNPIMESKRRDDGLAEGGKLKKLLAFVRTSACKSDVGRTPDVTYLKQLANNRVKRGNARHSALAPSCSFSSQSTGSPPLSPLADLSPLSTSSMSVHLGGKNNWYTRKKKKL